MTTADLWERTGVVVLVYAAGNRHEPLLNHLLREGADPTRIVVAFNPAEPMDESPVVPLGVRVLRMPSNVGYAAAMNAGMAALGPITFLVLCTDDARPSEGSVQRLLNVAAQDGVGFVGPVLYRPDGSIFSAGGTFVGKARHARHLQACREEGRSYDVEWLDGALVATSSAAVAEIGQLDERFFLYGEDVEWGLRCRQHGLRMLVEPDATATQTPGAELRLELFAYLGVRNGLRICRLHFSRSVLLHRLVDDCRMASARMLRSLDGPRSSAIGRARLRGVVDGLLGRSGPPPRHLRPDGTSSEGANGTG